MNIPGLDDGGSVGRIALDNLTVHLNFKPGSLGTPVPDVVAAVRRLVGLRLPGDTGDDVVWEE
jgi:hypothetical protein